MNREVHVRIWERPEVRVLRATRRPLLSVYLMEPDIEKVVEFLSRKAIRKARITWERANGTNRAMPLRLASSNCHR
jgi:hypothetical protein